jgi:hypothetical protein
VTFSLPELFKVSVCDWLVPTCTLPKLKLVGFPLRLPAATAVPERATLSGLLDPSFVSARLALALPADWGLKTMLKVALCPASSVKGRVNPLVLNPAPVTAASVTVRLDSLVLVIVSARV